MPPDAPAESVLDEMDESGAPLPMVGRTRQHQRRDHSGARSQRKRRHRGERPGLSRTQCRQPQPTQDTAKPAVNQATPPAIQVKE